MFSKPHIREKRKLPSKPNGTLRITAKGMKRLSYKAHNIRYMNKTQMMKITAVIEIVNCKP